MKKILIMLCLVAGAAVHAEEWKPIDLLHKRWVVAMPEGSRIEERGHSIMAAPEANENATRVVHEAGGRKLVLMAWELFKTAGASYDAEVATALEQWAGSAEVEFKMVRPAKNVVAGIPAKPNTADDAILHAAAFLRHPDGSVQRVAIYFNPEFHKTPDACAAMAMKILKSLKTGERKLRLDRGVKRFDVGRAGVKVAMRFPEGWIVTTQEGPDFLVHRASEVAEFGSAGRSIGLYAGGHPGYHHRRIEEDELVKTTRIGTLFGKDQEWTAYSVKTEGAWKNAEIIAGIPGAGEDWFTHVFASAPDEKGLAELIAILATSRAEKK